MPFFEMVLFVNPGTPIHPRSTRTLAIQVLTAYYVGLDPSFQKTTPPPTPLPPPAALPDPPSLLNTS